MSKNIKCLNMLKTYGILVDFDGKPKDKAGTGKLADETFGQWKRRVLGDSVDNLVVYIPVEVPPQKRMRILKQEGGAPHILRVVSEFTKLREEALDKKLSESEKELLDKFSTIPKRTLRDVVDSLEEELEPSVCEFFDRFFGDADTRISARELLLDLASAYNTAVKNFRKAANLP